MPTIKVSQSLLASWILGLVLWQPLYWPSNASQLSGDCNTPLQTQINNTPVGGTLILGACTFTASVSISKNLTINGASQSTTILQAPSNQRVIEFTDTSTLTLQHLTVKSGNVPAGMGAGIDAPAGSLILNDVGVTNNSASYGGGIALENSSASLSVTDSLISSNTSVNHGGGIYSAGKVTLQNTNFSSNIAGGHGGGLYVNSGDTVIQGGTFDKNTANSGNGGGIDVNDNLSLSGTTFTNNTAGDSGGGVAQWNIGKTVTFTNTNFNNNSAINNGGGAFIHQSYLTINTASFVGNQLQAVSSGSVYGGGLYAGGGLQGSHLTVTSNVVSCLGCLSWLGGGIDIEAPTLTTSSISQSHFQGNLAWLGSGLASACQITLTVTQTDFISNGDPISAGYGGGIQACNTLNGDHLTFQNNTVLNEGGAIQESSALIVTNSRFLSNAAGTSAKGGAIWDYSNFTGTNLLFDSNRAYDATAVYVDAGTSVLEFVTVGQATYTPGSAIYVDTGATIALKNSIITGYTNGVFVAGTLNEDNNLLYNDTYFTGTGTVNHGNHSQFRDPLFINPAKGDYHLKWGSPAIGLATDVGITTDLDGQLRSGRIDAGAYQFHSSIYLPMLQR